MYDEFKKLIAAQLSELSGAPAEIITLAIDLPKATTYGDLAIAVPRLRLKGNPVQLAQSYAEQFKTNADVTAVVATGPYLNFRINRTAFTHKVLTAVHAAGDKYGWTDTGAGKRVIIDFSSPNIAKPFHAGHLRSTIIGNFIYKLHKAHGWDAISMNYLGDWGKQYGLLAIGFARFGSEEGLAADPIAHLYEVYVAVNTAAKSDPNIDNEACAYFKKMEDGDEGALALWQRFRELSIAKYRDTYTRLGIHFDVYSGESQVGEGMERAMQMLEDADLLTENKGAKVVDLKKYGLQKASVQTSEGSTLYMTRDIGAAIERYEMYQFDKMYYVVSTEQNRHFKQLFKTIELLGLPYADRLQHVNFGLVEGMSTRNGTAVFLDDMLQESKNRMHHVMRKNDAKYRQVDDPEHVADVLGMSAIIVQDMSAKRINEYDFSWDRILNFKGDTGPYLQYTHARLYSLERNCGPVNLDADASLLTEESARKVVTLLSHYPAILATAMQTLEPCTIIQYMLKLSHAVSAAWETMLVRNQPKDLADVRLLMYSSARIVLANALTLLGLEPIQRM
ncbi:arginyl-tRNA synthetase [Coemansia sp. RSA 1933]|nr:arginyl-tRNA synthetase [Coemansia sp. RSA 1933]